MSDKIKKCTMHTDDEGDRGIVYAEENELVYGVWSEEMYVKESISNRMIKYSFMIGCIIGIVIGRIVL